MEHNKAGDEGRALYRRRLRTRLEPYLVHIIMGEYDGVKPCRDYRED